MFEGQWRPFFATKRRLGRRYSCIGRPSREFHAIAQIQHPEERPHDQAYDVKEKRESESRLSFPERKMGGRGCLMRASSSEVRAAARHLLSPTTPASPCSRLSAAAARRDFAQHLHPRAPLQQGTTQTSSFVGLLEYFNMLKRKDVVQLADKAIVKKAKPEAKQAPVRKEKLVEGINALSVEDFKSRFVQEDMLKYQTDRKDSSRAFDLSLVAADWLTPGEYNAAFNLIEDTSRPDYESSTFGWHPRRKRKEMLEPEMKYLLVRPKDAEPTIERKPKSGDVDTSVLGFLSFMVDHDSSPSVPVLYIYEIHLAESLRGLGLGNHLIQVTERIASNIGLDKVMLTCFLCNKKAHQFYTDRGFGKDSCSPADRKTRNKVVAVDYVIMSKGAPATVAKPRQITDDNARERLDDSNGLQEYTSLSTT
jgi:GNAT superfamily N-acetyltransferase